VKHTGGNWDPDNWPCYFLASGTGSLNAAYSGHPWVLVAVDAMLTDGAYRNARKHMDRWLADGVHVLVDSGIFWLTNEHKRAHGMTMDQALALHPNEIDGFYTLFDRYLNVCRDYGDVVWGYVELDQGGQERKRETRARLEDEFGLAPIPVCHPLNDGREYMDELMAGYDRICFGNIVQANRPTRLRLLHLMWEARARHPDTWVHLLGLTPSELSLAFPAQSADSSSWLATINWPHSIGGERSMLKQVSGFPRNHAYRRADSDSYNEAKRQAAYGCAGMQATWRAVLAERAELGCEPFDRGALA